MCTLTVVLTNQISAFIQFSDISEELIDQKVWWFNIASCRLFAAVMVDIAVLKTLNVRCPQGSVWEGTVWSWTGLRRCRHWEPRMLCVLMDSLSVRQARHVVSCPQDNMDAALCLKYVKNVWLFKSSNFSKAKIFPSINICLYWVYVPLQNFSLIWRCHHYQWRQLACHTVYDIGHPF